MLCCSFCGSTKNINTVCGECLPKAPELLGLRIKVDELETLDPFCGSGGLVVADCKSAEKLKGKKI